MSQSGTSIGAPFSKVVGDGYIRNSERKIQIDYGPHESIETIAADAAVALKVLAKHGVDVGLCNDPANYSPRGSLINGIGRWAIDPKVGVVFTSADRKWRVENFHDPDHTVQVLFIRHEAVTSQQWAGVERAIDEMKDIRNGRAAAPPPERQRQQQSPVQSPFSASAAAPVRDKEPATWAEWNDSRDVVRQGAETVDSYFGLTRKQLQRLAVP
jgi:hypothetical protein